MKAMAKRLTAIGALALLASCSPPPIEIAVERVGERLVLHFSQDWGILFSDRKAPCLRTIGLYEPGTFHSGRASWLIEAEGGVQCLDLASVAVGDVPDGWREVVPVSTAEGRTYALVVHGIGDGEATIRF